MTSPSIGPRFCLPLLLVTFLGLEARPFLGDTRWVRETEADTEERWFLVGHFGGAEASGWREEVRNWIFEYERDGDLYQDLGDVGLGLSFDVGKVRLEWDTDFSRRVVPHHEALPSGAQVGPRNSSTYLQLASGTTRLRGTWNYWEDIVGPVNLGVQVEGGQILARTRRMDRSEDWTEKPPFSSVRDDPGSASLLRASGELLSATTDWIGDSLKKSFADTERGELFYEGLEEPVRIYLDMGYPLKAESFLGDRSVVRSGEMVTNTVFLGLSPVRAGFRESGFESTYKNYFRVIRETSIYRESDDVFYVRVRDSFKRGHELIPLKLRPELRLGIVKVGYTFLESLVDRGSRTESDRVFRLDVDTPAGRSVFEDVIEASDRLKLRPAPRTSSAPEGAELLSSEFRRGAQRHSRFRFRIFSLYSREVKHAGSAARVRIGDADFIELVDSRTRSMRKAIGKRQDLRVGVFVVGQAGIAGQERSGDQLEGDEEDGAGSLLAMTAEFRARSRYSSIHEARNIMLIIARILGVPRHDPGLQSILEALEEKTTRTAGHLTVSYGPLHFQRWAEVSENELWEELAEMLLGPDLRGTWNTEEKRFWWMPRRERQGRMPQWDGHVSDHLDRQRGARDSRRLFIRAWSIARAFQRMQEYLGTGVRPERVLDIVGQGRSDGVLQSLLIRLVGGVEQGRVGYSYEFLTDTMSEPFVGSNGIDYAIDHHRGAQLLGTVDALRESLPRLRSGSLFLRNLAETGEARWKLRVYSPYRFGPDLTLAVSLREDRVTADRVIRDFALKLGEPMRARPSPFYTLLQLEERGEQLADSAGGPGLDESLRSDVAPFLAERFYYDVMLPQSPDLEPGETYTLLLRVVGPDRVPVTEEQKLRFRMPQALAEEDSAPELEAPSP